VLVRNLTIEDPLEAFGMLSPRRGKR
jgi:hypothetical protein